MTGLLDAEGLGPGSDGNGGGNNVFNDPSYQPELPELQSPALDEALADPPTGQYSHQSPSSTFPNHSSAGAARTSTSPERRRHRETDSMDTMSNKRARPSHSPESYRQPIIGGPSSSVVLFEASTPSSTTAVSNANVTPAPAPPFALPVNDASLGLSFAPENRSNTATPFRMLQGDSYLPDFDLFSGTGWATVDYGQFSPSSFATN